MNYSKLYAHMVQLQIMIKLLHFQTKTYRVHKITDDFLNIYNDMFDTFWEVTQSNKFRILFKTPLALTLDNVNLKEELLDQLDQVIDLLLSIKSGANKVSAENIVEEAENFKYLLTFE